MDNVPAIVPLLEREHRVAESRLDASRKELDDLASDKLKVGSCTLHTFLHTGMIPRCGPAHGIGSLPVSSPQGHACVRAARLALLRPHTTPVIADES